MATITAVHLTGSTYRVTVQEDSSCTTHDVTVTPQHLERYAPGATPERLLEASFTFLLEREPKEAILSQFDLPVIERYFPEYARAIRRRL